MDEKDVYSNSLPYTQPHTKANGKYFLAPYCNLETSHTTGKEMTD